jgi:hypothetical protein
MIGSPASRGAVASVVGAGRACLAAASAVSAANAAIAASVTMAGPPHRRVATVDCAVMNRFTMSTRYLRNESAEIYFQMPIVLCASPHSSVQARGVPDDQ